MSSSTQCGPVLTARTDAWPWSSAPAHLAGSHRWCRRRGGVDRHGGRFRALSGDVAEPERDRGHPPLGPPAGRSAPRTGSVTWRVGTRRRLAPLKRGRKPAPLRRMVDATYFRQCHRNPRDLVQGEFWNAPPISASASDGLRSGVRCMRANAARSGTVSRSHTIT